VGKHEGEIPVFAYLCRYSAEWHSSSYVELRDCLAPTCSFIHKPSPSRGVIYALVSSAAAAAAGSASLASGSAAAGSPDGSASEEVQRV
jgi:hypothetical protein